ncbi:hypothetical protein [Sphingosinicella sp. BN140058]|uniref:hypothetical protein n=1 Tax=Sphingosinicella sp. BN140058 TaxID=1892855 RepID=UPI0010107195|nr:hypothetical protein [Sphingosinicella sp. BN140058]QAY80420.1 hypothetical protein ETR14_27660 [Sphingosinicella sp. BN140058]
MNIFFVAHGDIENNFDLHVEAETSSHAVQLWRAYYALLDDAAPSGVVPIAPIGTAEAGTEVYFVADNKRRQPRDLHVWAIGMAQALDAWRAHFGLPDATNPEKLYALRRRGTAGALGWDDTSCEAIDASAVALTHEGAQRFHWAKRF